MTVKPKMDESFDHACRGTCSGWDNGYDHGRRDISGPQHKVTIHELKQKLKKAEEALKFYASGKHIYSHPFTHDGTEQIRDRGEVARETLAKIRGAVNGMARRPGTQSAKPVMG